MCGASWAPGQDGLSLSVLAHYKVTLLYSKIWKSAWRSEEDSSSVGLPSPWDSWLDDCWKGVGRRRAGDARSFVGPVLQPVPPKLPWSSPELGVLPEPSLKAWVAAPLPVITGRPGGAVLALHDTSHSCHRAGPCSRQALSAVPQSPSDAKPAPASSWPKFASCSFQLLSLIYAFCSGVRL